MPLIFKDHLCLGSNENKLCFLSLRSVCILRPINPKIYPMTIILLNIN